jgi:hypothetical protein
VNKSNKEGQENSKKTLRWMKFDFSTRQSPPFDYKMLVTLTKEASSAPS